MRKAKKFMALLLAGVLSLSVFTGCGSSEKPAESSAPAGSEAGQAAEGTEGGEASMTYNGQDVSEPVELVMYYIGDETEDQDKVLEEVNKIFKEKINATLTLKNMSASDYSTKYALTIAGGETIDLIYTSTWAYYQSEANKGAFAEVTEQVINDYMPLHKEGQAEASWGQAQIGGKVFFVPCNMANVNAKTVMIRGDLREKYGLDKLQTIEDLEAYYAAVAADPESGVSFAYDASQNNDNLRTTLFFAKNDFVELSGALQNYLTYKYSENVSAEDVFWIFGTEEYKEYATMMKSWADQGFWSKSAIANNTDTQEAFKNGTSASYAQNLGSLGAAASAVVETHPEWKPEICELVPEAHRFNGAYTGDGIAVLAASKNQARAFMALDLMKFDPDVYNLIRFGIEGTHYNKVGEDMWSPAADMAKHPFGNGWSWGLKNSALDRSREDTYPDQKALGDEWTAKAVAGPTAAFAFDDTNVKNELANLQSIYTQYVPLLDLGLVEDVDKTLEEFNKQAEAAGLQKVIDEAKAQLTTYFESVK